MKAAAIVISILLVIVLLTGAVSTLSSGFTNFEVRSWLDRFAASDEPVIEEPVEEDPLEEELTEDDFQYLSADVYNSEESLDSFLILRNANIESISFVNMLDEPVSEWNKFYELGVGNGYQLVVEDFLDKIKLGNGSSVPYTFYQLNGSFMNGDFSLLFVCNVSSNTFKNISYQDVISSFDASYSLYHGGIKLTPGLFPTVLRFWFNSNDLIVTYLPEYYYANPGGYSNPNNGVLIINSIFELDSEESFYNN